MEQGIDLRSKKYFILAVVLLDLFAPASLLAVSQPDDLFHKALIKESVERDLEGAISLYQQTVGHPRVGPAVAGEARLRMGLCYEKLGKPQDAESVYRQLLEKTAGVSPDIVRQARAHLKQVEAQNLLNIGPENPAKVVWARRFKLTPLSILLGPSLYAAKGSQPVYALAAGFRWRLVSADRPERFYIQGRGFVPVSDSTVQEKSSPSNLTGTTNASLKIQYQTSLGLIGELPHGRQRTYIPEVGGGFALTASKISYANATVSGDHSESHWSPYLETGLHLFSDRNLSLLINATYVPTPYPQSIQAAGLTGSPSFYFSSSQWNLSAMLQLKMGYHRLVPEIQK